MNQKHILFPCPRFFQPFFCPKVFPSYLSHFILRSLHHQSPSPKHKRAWSESKRLQQKVEARARSKHFKQKGRTKGKSSKLFPFLNFFVIFLLVLLQRRRQITLLLSFSSLYLRRKRQWQSVFIFFHCCVTMKKATTTYYHCLLLWVWEEDNGNVSSSFSIVMLQWKRQR